MKITRSQLRRIIQEMSDVSIKRVPNSWTLAQTKSAVGHGISSNPYLGITGMGDNDEEAVLGLERQLPRKIKQINKRIADLEEQINDLKTIRSELMSPTNIV